VSASCPVCGGERLQAMTAATGARAYCLTCFHGWRTESRAYAYDATAMCPFGAPPERLAAQIAFIRPRVCENARVLEIGCATGVLAALARETLAPARYEAIELSPAGEQARTRVDRLHVRPLGELLAEGSIESGFDLVIMSHVLEHLDDPAAELTSIRKVLKPDGLLFLEVPNRSGNLALPIDDNRSHLHFFSTTSLTRLLAETGMEVLATETGAVLDPRYADSLRVAARGFQLPKWRPGFLSDHPRLAGESDIVVWGAGSLADELLANFFDPGKIAFFIDRNPAKQGTLCLGRPVLAPEALGAEPRAILINSIDFAPQIAADIAQLYPDVAHRVIPVGDLLD
jgi:SAM-dependent methyltransferase